MKREQIFLDFASIGETRKFNSYLEFVYSILSYSGLTGSDNERSSKNHWIYYHYLGGIGESLFIKDDGTNQLRCLTFHEFCTRYKQGSNSDFRGWVKEVEAIVQQLSTGNDDLRWRRLQMLWIVLDRFLEFSDPKKLWTTRDRDGSKNIDGLIREQIRKQAKWYGLRIM